MGARAPQRAGSGIRGAIAAVGTSLLLLAIPEDVAAADTYVDDDTGSGTACTLAQPCAAIQQGIFTAGPGDDVFVDGGTYAENLTLADDKSLIAHEFVGDVEPQTVVDGGALVTIGVSLGESAGTIAGFTLRSDAPAISLEGPATVTGNTFDDTASTTAVNILNGADGSSVTGNTFEDGPSETDFQVGVQAINSGSATIAGNTFHDLQNAIHLANGAATVTGNTITGTREGTATTGVAINVSDASPTIVANDIRSPASSGIVFGIDIFDPAGPPDTGATLRRNEIYDHTTGVSVSETIGAVTMNGDVISGATSSGLFARDTGTDDPNVGDVTASNVTVFNNTASDIFPNATHLTLDSSIVGNEVNDFNGTCTISFSRGPLMNPGGNGCDNFQTTALPMFVNSAANNYHLRTGSPMIDAGRPANPGFVLDLDGQARAIAGTCGGAARRDIGADEFKPSCAPPPPPPAAKDTDPPETKIDKAPKRKTHKRKAKFRFSSDEPGSTFECKLDKRPFKECESPYKKKVNARKHKFRVRAVDAVGNVDASPARKKFKVLD